MSWGLDRCLVGLGQLLSISLIARNEMVLALVPVARVGFLDKEIQNRLCEQYRARARPGETVPRGYW